MDREKVIKGLQIERECVSRDCNRDCGKCDLVQEREWLLSVYDGAIALLKEQEETINKLRAALQMKTTMTFTQIGDNNKQIINTGAMTMNL